MFLLPSFFASSNIKIISVTAPIPFHYIVAVICQTGILFFYLILSYRVLLDYQRPYQLSQVINTSLGQNFYNLINSYRVEEAKQQLSASDKQNQTILAIAYDVGFNSKSVFNKAFKKFTGTTPSKYRLNTV